MMIYELMRFLKYSDFLQTNELKSKEKEKNTGKERKQGEAECALERRSSPQNVTLASLYTVR